MTLPRLPLTRAVAALVGEATGRPCGMGVLPRDSSGQPAQPPYAVLDSLTGSFSGPSLSDWAADASWLYQVTSVGQRVDQALWLADRVREALFGRSHTGWANSLSVPGMKVIDRELSTEGSQVDGTAGDIVTYIQRFTLTVTPV
ncbi:hypothetical protein [Streptomyces luteireticuli]|uniref:hypothetical protein n=1 Tax=Streptomyces luteireticuli TaxID=173858 RepID=UPI0035593031